MLAFLAKKWIITLTLIVCMGSGAFSAYHFMLAQPQANCPQPPRNIDPETMSQQERAYYGYPPLGGKITPQWDKEYQLHGTHVCGSRPCSCPYMPGITDPRLPTPTKAP